MNRIRQFVGNLVLQSLLPLFSMILISLIFFFFFFNDTATTEIYTLSLHDALPICIEQRSRPYPESQALPGSRQQMLIQSPSLAANGPRGRNRRRISCAFSAQNQSRSEEHTSELQSLTNLVCRLLLEKKKNDRLECK